jgi:hypothetical protein
VPYTQLGIPWNGRSAIARHNGQRAAESLAPLRGRKKHRLLEWARQVGTFTDAGAAECLGWPLSSLCSLRNALMDEGYIRAIGSTEGRYGKTVTVYEPTSQVKETAIA